MREAFVAAFGQPGIRIQYRGIIAMNTVPIWWAWFITETRYKKEITVEIIKKSHKAKRCSELKIEDGKSAERMSKPRESKGFGFLFV